MREMKISKASLLTMWWIFSIASLWLMFFSVSAVDDGQDTENHVQLYFDPNNAIQHFQGVKIIPSNDNDDSYAIIKKNWWLVWIETDYNFLMSGWDTDSNSIDASVRRSTILWWKNNKINWWTNEAILWWENNTIASWDSNSILWWVRNELKDGNNSTIFGWSGNNIKWNNSSIIWSEWNSITGNNSVVIWNHSEVNWNNSVSMWQNSKLKWNNSFLWTDGSQPELTTNNVFVVKWDKGMVVNKNKAHSFTQLTIWGSLIIYSGDMAPQCWNRTKWVVKVVNNGDRKCLCSCDGSWWNALHAGVMCPFLCSNTPPEAAMCDNDSGKWDCTTHTYTWTCKTWTVVQWEWAFFVSTIINWGTITNYINWSCQSDTWAVESCRTKLEENWCPNKQWWECIWPQSFSEDDIKSFKNNTIKIEESNHNPGGNTYNRAYNNWEYNNEDCAYYCKEWFIAFEWNCYKCDAWSWDPNDPYKCKFNVDCGEWREWNKELSKCELNWVCRYKKDDSVFNKNKWLQNITAEDIEEILPQKNSWEDYYLSCIDDGDNKADYIEHSCAYKCKPWYYCKGWKDEGVCTLPSCNLGQINAHGDKNYYYVTWHASYKQFNATPDWVSTGANETSWRFYSTYANKNGCYYWCPQEYRIKYKGYRRCLSKEQQEGLTDDKYCSNGISIYWNTLTTYKNPTKADQGWTYVSPKELSEKKANKAEWCFWSCEEWSIVAYWQAIRISTYNYWWNAGQKLIFDSSAKSCYKKCGTWEILDGNGRCKPCPAGEVPNPNSLQTWKFKRIGKYGTNKKAPFLQLYDTTEPAPERIYSDFSEYRKCVKDCWTGKVLDQNGECIEKYTAWNCSWEDRKIIGTECVECMQTTSIRSGDECVKKEWKLEFSIKDQTNKNIYTGWKIIYKITMTNRWNLAITGIESLVTIGNTTEVKKYNNILWTWKKYSYTWAYIFTGNDFTWLNEWETWDFVIKLEVKGMPNDKYVNNLILVPNPDTITVTIKK